MEQRECIHEKGEVFDLCVYNSSTQYVGRQQEWDRKERIWEDEVGVI